MINYRQFISNKFLILEDRFEENYWFKLSYQELIYFVKHEELKINKSLTVVTKNSDNSNKYDDIYKYPVTIYCDKEKLIKFFNNQKYKTSLLKDNIFLESIESDEIEDDDILSDEEIQNNLPQESSNDDNNEEVADTVEDTEEKESTEETDNSNESDSTEEQPPEISINEDTIEIPMSVMTGIEVNLKKMTHSLDSDLVNIAKLLDMNTNSLRNKTDQNARDEVKIKFDSLISAFCKKNNIPKNFIED